MITAYPETNGRVNVTYSITCNNYTFCENTFGVTDIDYTIEQWQHWAFCTTCPEFDSK